MQGILYTVIGLSVASLFVELLCSGSGTGKYVKAVFGIICAVAMLSSFLSAIRSSFIKLSDYDVTDEPKFTEQTEALREVNKRLMKEYVMSGLCGNNIPISGIEIEYGQDERPSSVTVLSKEELKGDQKEKTKEIIEYCTGVKGSGVFYEYG